ncbi:hypothetical protein CIB48_g6704 [Xylaria polymorpha]|nr:hypothetical protein CIB48_g6704 [Xylaria polymorpha]
MRINEIRLYLISMREACATDQWFEDLREAISSKTGQAVLDEDFESAELEVELSTADCANYNVGFEGTPTGTSDDNYFTRQDHLKKSQNGHDWAPNALGRLGDHKETESSTNWKSHGNNIIRRALGAHPPSSGGFLDVNTFLYLDGDGGGEYLGY